MSTQATIAYAEKSDNTIKLTSIYVHGDGYIEHTGKILLEHYKTPEIVQELIALGDMSHIGKNIYPNPKKIHKFGMAQDNTCVAYHRDRGEDWSDVKPQVETHSIDFDMDEWCKKECTSYVYVFLDGKWYVNGSPLESVF